MYVIFGTIIVLVIVFFGSSIFSMIKTYATNPNPTVKIGNMWFISLLLINITLVIFIYSFYYYKSTSVGSLGKTGDKGFTGKSGKECIITLPNANYYANYNKLQ